MSTIPKPVRMCTTPNCDRKHFALGSCRQHYYQIRWAAGKDHEGPARPRVTVGALVDSIPTKAPDVVIVETHGMWIYCPRCFTMASAEFVDDPWHRVCPNCSADIRVNAEEAQALIAEAIA